MSHTSLCIINRRAQMIHMRLQIRERLHIREFSWLFVSLDVFVNFRHIVGPPYRESTLLTISVPGSVADTHRRTESRIESLTSLKTNLTQSNTNLKKVLTKRLAGHNLLHCGSTAQNTQNHRQKLGRRRNPNYSSSSTPKSPSASSAEKHGIGGVSTLHTQQVPSLNKGLFRCMG